MPHKVAAETAPALRKLRLDVSGSASNISGLYGSISSISQPYPDWMLQILQKTNSNPRF